MSGFNLMEDKLTNAQIAWRAAQDIEDGSYVNLGIGFPEMIAKFQPDGRDVTYHTENGVLGFGKAPAEGQEDWDLINAGKKAITLKPGASFFHHADSFSMVRGGHLDLRTRLDRHLATTWQRLRSQALEHRELGPTPIWHAGEELGFHPDLALS